MQSLYQTCLGPGGRHPSLRHSSGHCPCTRRTGGGGRKAARGLAASASAWLPIQQPYKGTYFKCELQYTSMKHRKY